MKPSIGRIVHYVPFYDPASGCKAAIITEVREDGIGICIFHPSAFGFVNRDLKEDQNGKARGSWHWPERVE